MEDSMHYRLFLGLVVALALGEQVAPSQTLHAVIAADVNDPKIGTSVAVDQKAILAVLRNGFPKDRLRIHVLKQEQLTRKGLLDFITNLQVDNKKDAAL